MATQMALNVSDKPRITVKVLKQTFFNEQSMFTIMRVEIEDGPIHPEVKPNSWDDSYAVKGVLRLVNPGERFILEGKWVNDETWGWQFVFDHFERHIPTTEEGIIDYLSSGSFRGIGEGTAKKIVAKFGLETMHILATNPERLTEIRGFSAAKLTAFKEDYLKVHVYEDMYLKLSPFDVSMTKVVKIVDKYQERSMDVVSSNPYLLCEDIDGIGFTTADKIAGSMGIPANAQFRLVAATKYVMSEVSNSNGHTYLPLPDLQKQLYDQLQKTGRGVEQNEIARVISDMIEEQNLHMEQDQAVYMDYMLKTEERVAKKLISLMLSAPLSFPKPMDQLIDETEEALNIKYDEHQKKAFHSLSKGNVQVITGGPGTGKSTILKGYIRIIQELFPQFQIGLCSPTGKAASRMKEVTGLEAKTIHRLLGCRPGKGGHLEPQYDEFEPLDFDVVVIDEGSMMDLQLASMLFRALKKGSILVILGDVDQLPSVGAGAVLDDLIRSGVIPVTRLTKIFRQAGTSRIVVNAAQIRDGKYEGWESGDDFSFVKAKDISKTANEVVRLYKECLDEGLSMSQIQVLTPFRKNSETGAEMLNKRLQRELNPPAEDKGEMVLGLGDTQRIFRQEDPVMVVKNNYDKEIFNGSTGFIVEASRDQLTVEFDDCGTVIFDRDEVGELVLNYCCTIHKSQGSEYHTCIIVCNKAHYTMLRRRLIYTGVTRAKKRVYLVGEAPALKIAVTTDTADQRFTKLSDRLRLASASMNAA